MDSLSHQNESKVSRDKSLRIFLRSLYGPKQSACPWLQHSTSIRLVVWRGLLEFWLTLVYLRIEQKINYCTSLWIWLNRSMSKRVNSKGQGEFTKILSIWITRGRKKPNTWHWSRPISTLRRSRVNLSFLNLLKMARKTPIDGYDPLRQASENEVLVDPKEYASIIDSIVFTMV